MQTTIAQAVALVIAGNTAMHKDAPDAGWPCAGVFTVCNQVRFVSLSEKPAAPDAVPYAPDPNA